MCWARNRNPKRISETQSINHLKNNTRGQRNFKGIKDAQIGKRTQGTLKKFKETQMDSKIKFSYTNLNR